MEQHHSETGGPDPSLPPGTVLLESREHTTENSEIILHPHPINDPNDPLVSLDTYVPLLPLLTC